jgi:hypothetical protein
MTYFEIALTVLRQARRALTTREIVDAATSQGLLVPKGKTPEATMAAALYARATTDPRIQKLEIPGRMRAKRGSVRWSIVED